MDSNSDSHRAQKSDTDDFCAGESNEAYDRIIGEQALEQALIEDDAYERIIVGTPDILREVVKGAIVHKAQNDQDTSTGNDSSRRDFSLERSISEPAIDLVTYPSIVAANDINVPGGFRREHLHCNSISNEPLNGIATETKHPSFLERLLDDFSPAMFSWIERSLKDAEDENSSEDDYEEHFRASFRNLYPDSKRFLGNDAKKDLRIGRRECAVCLCKIFVASGVLFLPSAFRNAGLLAGCITLFLSGMASLWGALLLARTRDYLHNKLSSPSGGGQLDQIVSTPLVNGNCGGSTSVVESIQNESAVEFTTPPQEPIFVTSYSEVALYSIGPIGHFLVQWSTVFSQIAFCCVYVSFSGNALSNMTNAALPLWVYMIFPGLVLIPVILVRHMKYLAIPGMIGNVCIVVSLLFVTIWSVVYLAKGNGVKHDWSCDPDRLDETACYYFNKDGYFIFLGSAVYVFEGIALVLPIRNSMRHQEHFAKTMTHVMVTLTLCFIAFASITFLAYGPELKPLVLDNLPRVESAVVNSLTIVAVLATFPLMAIAATRIFDTLFFGRKKRPGLKWRKNTLRIMIVVFCVLVSIAVGPEVDKLVAVVGGLFCVPIALIYPQLSFLCSGCPRNLWLDTIPSIIMVIVGTGAAILSTYESIVNFNS